MIDGGNLKRLDADKLFLCYLGILTIVIIVLVCIHTHKHTGIIRETHGEYAVVMDCETGTEWRFYNVGNLRVGDTATITFWDKCAEYESWELYRVTLWK